MATNSQSTLDEVDKDGNVKRTESTFRGTVSSSDPVHKPEAGRYHLYVCNACPWSQRALIARALKGLEGVIGVSATHPTWQKTLPDDDNDHHYGWAFASPDDPPFVPPGGYGSVPSGPGAIPDPLHSFKTVRQIYDMAVGPGKMSKYTVPILWDEKTKKVVNNESSEIIQIFNTAFNDVEGVGNPGLDLAPQTDQERAWAEEVDDWLYNEVCNGVYRSGFAKTQGAYDVAVTSLFAHLDKLEQVLSTRRYLAGDRVTLSDVRVFPSLVRFDEVYNVYFKCNKKRLVDYPNILNYVRDLYQSYPEGFASTTDMDHIRKHYYTSHAALNTYAIVPVGPNFLKTLTEPHDRDRTF
ncbi:Putative Glutathione S-transferase [Ectocarpus siliculosus]|uniref:Glutathione S-transferase n=1 Tax=Ectocarpus siliculosus TaxID=2880 RepID=D7FPZ8_ECTSI|nr:Putative Glutathione S-transferase [Ectocarpus siliculosus]|eukprot:CBJ48330.1 Putative Glutathione S-transferase [Ectocarpus siliculosus]